MDRTQKRKRQIFDKTDGHCHLCSKKLCFNNYNVKGARAPWHIDHSTPKAKGGTDHLNNLFPACINCNQKKSTQASRNFRQNMGVTRIPYSSSRKEKIKSENQLKGMIIGGVTGWLVSGPVGLLVGATAGALIGDAESAQK